MTTHQEFYGKLPRLPGLPQMEPILGFPVNFVGWVNSWQVTEFTAYFFVKGRSKSPKTKNNFARYTDAICVPYGWLRQNDASQVAALIDCQVDMVRMSLEDVMRRPYWRIEKAQSRRIARYLNRRRRREK